MVRAFAVLIGVISAILLVIAIVPGLRDAGPVYTVAQLASDLAHHRQAWNGRTIMIQGRAMLASYTEPAPPSSLTRRKLWLASGLVYPPCPGGGSSECPSPVPSIVINAGPIPSGAFVNVRLVPDHATISRNPFVVLSSVPGVWIKVLPPLLTTTWLDRLRDLPLIGPFLPRGPHIRWGVTGIYRVQIRYSCTAYICDDAVLVR